MSKTATVLALEALEQALDAIVETQTIGSNVTKCHGFIESVSVQLNELLEFLEKFPEDSKEFEDGYSDSLDDALEKEKTPINPESFETGFQKGWEAGVEALVKKVSTELTGKIKTAIRDLSEAEDLSVQATNLLFVHEDQTKELRELETEAQWSLLGG